MLKQSYIYKMFVCLSSWLNKIFSESFLINLFVKDTKTQKRDTGTLFVKLLNKFIEVFRKLFAKLKLDKAFDNSIFAKPIIWLSLTVFFTPFLPTMLCLKMQLLLNFMMKNIKRY